MVVFVAAAVAIVGISAAAAVSIENGPKKKVNMMNKHITMEHVVNNTITNAVSSSASSEINASQVAAINITGDIDLTAIGNCKLNVGNITQDMDIMSSVTALADQSVQNEIAEQLTQQITNASKNTTDQSDDGAIGSIFATGSSENIVNVTDSEKTNINNNIKNIVNTAVSNIIKSGQDGKINIDGKLGAKCDGTMNPSNNDDSMISSKFDFFKEGVLGNLVKQMNESGQHYYIPNCKEDEDCDNSKQGGYEFKKGNLTSEDLTKMYILLDKISNDDANIKAFNINQTTLIKSVSSSIAKQLSDQYLNANVSSGDLDQSVNDVTQETKTALAPSIALGGSGVSCVIVIVIGLLAYFILPGLVGGGKNNHIGGNVLNKIKMSHSMYIKLMILLAVIYISFYR